MSKHQKFYLLFGLCILIILGFWIYSLKVNIQNISNGSGKKSGLTFSELKQEITAIINKSSLKKQTTDDRQLTTDELKNLTDKLTKELKSREIEENEIYYSFGIGEKNILDTKNNLYVKDMVCDPAKEYTFQLSNGEKTIIYNSIKENDLFQIKDELTKNCNSKGECFNVEPLSTSTLKITLNGATKTIKWSANYFETDDPDLKKFQNVTRVIQDIISQKEKEIKIEQPKCGYL